MDFPATRAAKINSFSQILKAAPLVILAKTGMSLDGKIADYRWNSKWITSSASRNDVQKERAMSSSILSTSSTIIKDDSRLNVRKKEYLSKLKIQPPLLILDSKLKNLLLVLFF